MKTKKVDEQKLKREFGESKDLRVEFGSVEAYVAFKKAESEGRIRGIKSSVVPASGPGPAAVDEALLSKKFDASADLQAEFGDVESYVAFKQADAAGRANICRGGGVTSFSSAPAPAPKTEKPGKGIPISRAARDVLAEVAIRAGIIQRDEKRQYALGDRCDANGMLCES